MKELKRIIAMFMALVVVTTMLPAVPLRAEEDEACETACGESDYDLWIGNVGVTAGNRDDIPCTEYGKVSYDPDSRTLKMKDVQLKADEFYTDSRGYRYLIYSKADLTIEVEGSCGMWPARKYSLNSAVRVEGALTIRNKEDAVSSFSIDKGLLAQSSEYETIFCESLKIQQDGGSLDIEIWGSRSGGDIKARCLIYISNGYRKYGDYIQNGGNVSLVTRNNDRCPGAATGIMCRNLELTDGTLSVYGCGRSVYAENISFDDDYNEVNNSRVSINAGGKLVISGAKRWVSDHMGTRRGGISYFGPQLNAAELSIAGDLIVTGFPADVAIKNGVYEATVYEATEISCTNGVVSENGIENAFIATTDNASYHKLSFDIEKVLLDYEHYEAHRSPNTNGFNTVYTVADQFIKNGEKAEPPVFEYAAEKEGFTEAGAFRNLYEKEYYIGWYTDEDCTQRYDFNTPVTTDTVLYGKAEEKLTVYSASSDAGLLTEAFASGTIPINYGYVPYKEGSVFTGWFLDEACTKAYDFDKSFTAGADGAYCEGVSCGREYSVKLYPRWANSSCTLSFDVGSIGSAPKAVTVKRNESVAAPQDPEAEGYIFGGWYTDKTYMQPYDFDTALTDDITVYAKWIKDHWLVSFDMNGHGTAPSAQKIKKGGTAAEPGKPVAEGYAFDGWYSDRECTKAYDFKAAVTEDTLIYAKWSRKAVSAAGISEKAVKLKMGESCRLEPVITPADAVDKSVSWKSSNEAAAKVDQNGNVTAIKAGTAKISFTTNDGGFSAECEVTVLKQSLGDDEEKTRISEEDVDAYVFTPEVIKNPVKTGEIKQKDGSVITLSTEVSYRNAVTYSGTKINPEVLEPEVDLSDLILKAGLAEKDTKDLFKKNYKSKNNKEAGTKASFYPLIGINNDKLKTLGLGSAEKKQLKALVKALNSSLKAKPCEYTINKVLLEDVSDVELKVKLKGDGSIKLNSKGMPTVKSLKVKLTSDGRQLKLSKKMYSFTKEDVKADNGTIKIKGLKNYTGSITVKVKK